MKKIKKLSFLFSLIVFTSCANISNKPLKGITDILGTETDTKKEEIVKEISTQDEFLQEDVVLTNENVSQYLEDIKNKLKNSDKRIETDIAENYKVFVGEYLAAPLEQNTSIKLTNFPKNTSSRLRKDDANFIFRTIYRGNYILSVYQGNSLLRKVNISAITKYNFSENNIYDIITQNLDKKNKTFEDAISLYKIYYPNGVNIRKVNYLLLDYAYEKKNTTMINEALDSLKNDLDSFNDEEKEKIIKAAKLVNKPIFIPASVYRTTNTKLEKEVTNYIKDKPVLDKKDVEFLEKTTKTSTATVEEKKSTLEKITDWYKNNGEVTKAKTVEAQASSSKAESLFDSGIKNMNNNPRLAIDNFKKSLSTERNTEKRAETYYNIANSYVKLGNKIEARKYLTLLKQEASTSTWAKKSDILLKTIK